MRTIYLNAGAMVHFSSAMAEHEQSIYAAGKGIVVEDGVITSIVDSEDVRQEYSLPVDVALFQDADVHIHDLHGQAIVPGLIDGHAHLLWAGDRSREVAWRQEGKSYAQISEMGGGIGHTVSQTRAASTEHLLELGYMRLRDALRTGTTHLEAKTGYGLTTESELRLLEIAAQLNGIEHTPSIESTWMGAHDVPKGMDRADYIDSLHAEQLPAVLEQGIARSVDVFCEPGWFSTEESEDILRAGHQGGLAMRMHIDEFADGGGGELAADLGVETADHAHHTPIEARMQMKEAGVNTGFLPGTPYAMGDSWPELGPLLEHDIPFTFASDFNPNCYTLSLPFVCSLMVQRCGLHPLAALASVTVNAARATQHPSGLMHGQLTEGAVANFNIIDGPHWESMMLRPSSSPFSGTVLNGKYISQ
mgnify:CR=1 FL=1